MSFVLQSHFSAESVAVNPEQIVKTNARGSMLNPKQGLRYIPPFKAPATLSPLLTLRDIIQQVERASYGLKPNERITGYDLASEVLARLAQEHGVRFTPALITATGRLITGLYARITTEK